MIDGQRGFTLIELMIVLVISAILLSIAYPSYQNQMQKNRRADAHATLLEIAMREQRFRTDNDTFTADLTQLGYAASPATSPGGFYQLTVTPGAGGIGNAFLITATPIAAQAGDSDCTSITLSSIGIQSSNAGVNECW